MRVAVTGATGLLGANLIRLLSSQGHEVVALRRQKSKTSLFSDLNITWKLADLLSIDSLTQAFEECHVVIHCAAVVGYGPALDRQMQSVNVQGTVNVLRAIKNAAVEQMIYCSSVDALGLTPIPGLSDEDTAWNWDLLGLDFGYARSKLEAERKVLEACRQGVRAVVVNPTFMIGPYDSKPSSGKLVKHIARGVAIAYPGGSNNFVDVRDVCRGILLVMQNGKPGERYILGGENMSYQNFFSLVAECAGRRWKPVYLPYGIARGIGAVGDISEKLSGYPTSFNSQLMRLGYVSHCYSSHKANRLLGYQAGNIRQAIFDALEWFNIYQER